MVQSKIAIYLAGSIKKGHEKADESYWTEDDIATIRNTLVGYEVTFLNPAFRTDDLSDQRSVFGRDMTQVFCSDVVFVDARDRRGLGVGAEMMWAKVNKIPVLTWAPINTHYNLKSTTILGVKVDNFIHPFVESLSDKIVENLTDGAEWIRYMINCPYIPIKGIEDIRGAMKHYKEMQFDRDVPMKEILFSSETLKQRFEKAHA